MKKVSVVLVDDLDGKVIEDGKGRSVGFSFDGQSYELDLSNANADKLRDALKPFVAAARKSSKAPASSGGKRARSAKAAPAKRAASSSAAKSDVQAIRAWANANGHQVGDRGRISTAVRDAYEKASKG